MPGGDFSKSVSLFVVREEVLLLNVSGPLLSHCYRVRGVAGFEGPFERNVDGDSFSGRFCVCQ